MEFRILGPLEVIADGKALDLGGPKQRALLALLLLEANRVISSDRLIEALWDETPPETAQKALQVYVTRLRKLLGKERLETKAPGYRVRVDPEELDLARFRRLRHEGKPEEALTLWRGPPLAEFGYERFAQPEIERLEELRLAALEERIERDLARGGHAELVAELEALVGQYPFRERLRGQLILALYRSGRQAEAVEAYQAARRALVDELGIEPSRALRDLHQAVLNQDPSLDVVSPSEEADEASEVARGAFVGRERELADLTAALDDALAGHGRLVLLAGEPGIGKSRLAEEVANRARKRGARVVVGRCWEAGGAPAYWPWVQALRTYVRESDAPTLRSELGTAAAQLAQIVPELRQHVADLPESAGVESEGARFRLFDAATDFFRKASQRRPIVVTLDDLHAADIPSLLLLRFLARELGSMRMLVLGAYRDVDPIPEQQLTETIAEIVREPTTRRVALGGLSEEAVAEYVDLTGSELASRQLVSALYEETEGNPLFVGETLRLLALERGRPGSATRIAIPQSVRDVIARRLGYLADDCKRVLVLASLLGREFAVTTLAGLSGLSENALLETLDEAMAVRVVSDVPGATDRLRFAHVLIRDTLYEDLTSARRVLLHRHAVETLEELYRDDPGHLAELAHHAIAGSEFAKGSDYARRAGDHALTVLAYEEAVRLYELALEALDLAGSRDEGARCELLVALGEAEAAAGNATRAKRASLEAAGIARRLGLRRQFARAAGAYAREDTYIRAGADRHVVPLLEEAVAALDEDAVELRARLLGRLAGALRDEPARDRRDALSREALELARSTGNDVALAYALDGRAAAIIAPDTVDECLAVAADLGEVAGRIGDGVRVLHAHSHRLVALIMVGGIIELEAALDAMSVVATELRQPAALWDVHAGRAVLAIAAGRLAEAERLDAEALAVGERGQPEVALATSVLQQSALEELRGRGGEVEPALRDVVAEYPARVAFRCALAHLHARLGRTAEAQRALDEMAVDRFSALPFDQEWLFGMSFLAETAALLGDADSAGVLYDLLLPYGRFNAADWPDGMRGSVFRSLGLLAMTTRRWADAESHFEAALVADEDRGAHTWLAHTRYEYGRMLLDRGEASDRDRARALLGSSNTLSAELGLAALAEKSSAILDG